MLRRSCLPFLVTFLVVASAAGSEFRFAARVDMLPWLSVQTDAEGADADGSPTVRVFTTQDRCLDVSVLTAQAPESGVNSPETRSTSTAVETRIVLDAGVRIIQITLN